MEYLGRNTERFKTVQVLNDLTVERVLFVTNINDTRPVAGQVLTWDGRSITWKDDSNTLYVAATSSVLGLLKIEDDTEQSVAANAVSATAARTYGIQFNSSDQAVVNVPWTDTTYTLPLATTSVRGGVELGSDTDLTETYETGGTGTASRTYPVQLNSANQMGVSVPWTDTAYTLPQATATARGGVELFSNTVQSVAGTAVSTTASRTYGVQLNSDDQMVVNVPWVDTDTKITLNGTTANGIATYGGVDTLDIESTLTYASNTLTDSGALTIANTGNMTLDSSGDIEINADGGDIDLKDGTSNIVNFSGNVASFGKPDNSTFNIGREPSGPGIAGGDISLGSAAPSAVAANLAGGSMSFVNGACFGNKNLGTYTFLGGINATALGGSSTDMVNGGRPTELWVLQSGPATTATDGVFQAYLFSPERNDKFLNFKCGWGGVSKISTVDLAGGTAADLNFSAQGDIEINAQGGDINFKHSSAQLALISTTGLDFTDNLNAGIQFEGSTDDAHKTRINVIDPTTTQDINFPNASGTVALTTDTLGGQYWHQMVPGYRQNNTSTTNYYTFYRNWYENWSNSDSNPTSISSTDSYSSFMIAPRAGQITNIKIQGTSNDVGYNDPFKFYMYKGALSNNSGSLSLTLIATTSAITPPASANKTWSHTQDFTGASFSEDDNLYIWLKKDSNTGNQDLFFNININGLYTN